MPRCRQRAVRLCIHRLVESISWRGSPLLLDYAAILVRAAATFSLVDWRAGGVFSLDKRRGIVAVSDSLGPLALLQTRSPDDRANALPADHRRLESRG